MTFCRPCSPLHTPAPDSQWCFQCNFEFSRILYKCNLTAYSLLCFCFFHLIWCSEVNPTVSGISSFFFCITEIMCVGGIDTSLFVYLPSDEHLSCLQFWAIVNKAMNIWVYVFKWIFVFISLGYILRGRITAFYGVYALKYIRKC